MKKIIVLLPDGGSLRNFLFSGFVSKCQRKSIKLTFWLPDVLVPNIHSELDKILFPKAKEIYFLANTIRLGWQKVFLLNQAKNFKNRIFLSYFSFKSFDISAKGIVRRIIVGISVFFAKNSDTRTQKIKSFYFWLIYRSKYFRDCLSMLKSMEIDLVFCTHQRALSAVAPILAARALGIPTACFIFSWDNLPKASLFIEADYYFVWSQYMYDELRLYHPQIAPTQIKVVGTPQFVPYFDETCYVSRELFATQYNLPIGASWVCYSGDDARTSPLDPDYLEDMALAIHSWNKAKPYNPIHIVFRRCPVDFSNRFDSVLSKYADVITPIAPLWQAPSSDSGWNSILPSPEDISLLVNTVRHCKLVVNIGSTMAHDFAIMGKPCIYINYNIVSTTIDWDISTVYKFIHFQSMEGLDPVIWLNHPEGWESVLHRGLYDGELVVQDCKKWTQRIAMHPLEDAIDRLVDTIKNIA